jgi:hypothetical protein
MHPSAPRVDRNEIVRIITNFYTFLTKLHIPESALKHPPPGGWPNITPGMTKNFNKSPLVVDIIKHLTYIDNKPSGEMITHIQYKCDVVDWSVYTTGDFNREGASNYCTAEAGIRHWISEIEEEQKGQGKTKEIDAKDDGSDTGDESDERDEDWDDFDPRLDLEVTDRPNLIGIAEGYESLGREFTLDVFKGVIYDDQIRCNLLGGWDVENFFQELQLKLECL